MSLNSGIFLPITQIFEIENLDQNIKINSPEYKDFLVRLRQILNLMTITLNKKETGLYEEFEILTGQLYFRDLSVSDSEKRTVSRTVVNFGALPNTGTKTVAHGITFPTPNTYSSVNIYGSATDPTGVNFISLPYASPILANNIELSVDNTNISITTGSDRTAFTKCYVVFEFIKL